MKINVKSSFEFTQNIFSNQRDKKKTIFVNTPIYKVTKDA